MIKMGYTTYFVGQFNIDRPLDQETEALINGLENTRRMKRDLEVIARHENMFFKDALSKYGIDGEFYVKDSINGECGIGIIDHNEPPSTQPSLWCQWMYDKGKQAIVWNEGEKFYFYIEWIEYLIERILKPRGYTLNGEMLWQGQSLYDTGKITISDNNVSTFAEEAEDFNEWTHDEDGAKLSLEKNE